MSDEGASPTELIIESSRRNNVDLLQEVLNSTPPLQPETAHEEAIATLLNNTRDALGNTALHIAAASGSYEVLDLLLDQPGLETDPVDRMSGDSPLHKAVGYCNTFMTAPRSASQSPATSTSRDQDLQSFLDANEGHSIVEILLDAGCDPRIRNKGKMKAVDLVEPRNQALRDFLRRAELMLTEGESGVVDADAYDEEGGSASE